MYKESSKPMTYSESVKKVKPRGPCKVEAPNVMAIKAREQDQIHLIDRLVKDRDKLKKSLDIMKREYNKLKTNFDAVVLKKREVIKSKVATINDCLLLTIPITCSCKENQHESSACVPAIKRMTALNENIVRKVISRRMALSEVREKYFVMMQRREKLKELVNLLTTETGRGGSTDDKVRQICDSSGDKGRQTYHSIDGKGRQCLQKQYKELKMKLQSIRSELKEAKEIQQMRENPKHEEIIKDRIKLLTEQVESRKEAMAKMNEETSKAEFSYDEKYKTFESLQEQLKEMKKELLEPVLNRRQFNLCLKENFAYNQRLTEVLEQRERVQFEYGTVMEEMKGLRNQNQAEEKTKERLFMHIMSLVEEGQQNKMEHEKIMARINQMHAEIFVRHGFMHAKQNTINELSEQCYQLETQILACGEEENMATTRYRDLENKFTETLFDICFSMSWNSVGGGNGDVVEGCTRLPKCMQMAQMTYDMKSCDSGNSSDAMDDAVDMGDIERQIYQLCDD